jgi:hypothetical protein
MKNENFWDITPCDSCKNRTFGGTYRLLTLSLALLFNIMKGTIRSSKSRSYKSHTASHPRRYSGFGLLRIGRSDDA